MSIAPNHRKFLAFIGPGKNQPVKKEGLVKIEKGVPQVGGRLGKIVSADSTRGTGTVVFNRPDEGPFLRVEVDLTQMQVQ